MTNKEYKNALSEHILYGGCDYLTPEALHALREDIKTRDGVLLKNCNNRATMRSDKNGAHVLTSYLTDVAIISGGRFYKIWRGYSQTTLKHVNEFRRVHGLPALNKREWIELETV